MRIAVLGTGMVGRALASGLARAGHSIIMGTRDPEATLVRPASQGESFATWSAEHPDIALATFAAAAAGAEVVVLATNGAAAIDVLTDVGDDNLSGKPLIDVTNPLDFSAGLPPTLFVKDDDSLGEQIQRAHPQARVVKTLNTVNADVMIHPESLGEPTSVFVSGNDSHAKAVASALLNDLGHQDVIDLGDISTARGPEMWLALWLRLWGALGTSAFNLRIVR